MTSRKSKKIRKSKSRKSNKRKLSRQTLPRPSNKGFSLSSMGYSIDKNKNDRRKILEKASEKYGTLPVLRHLNLRANYQQWNKDTYDKMKSDVDHLSKSYKRVQSKKSSRKSSRK